MGDFYFEGRESKNIIFNNVINILIALIIIYIDSDKFEKDVVYFTKGLTETFYCPVHLYIIKHYNSLLEDELFQALFP